MAFDPANPMMGNPGLGTGSPNTTLAGGKAGGLQTPSDCDPATQVWDNTQGRCVPKGDPTSDGGAGTGGGDPTVTGSRCPAGQVWNGTACVPAPGFEQQCPIGYVRDPVSNQCVRVGGGSGVGPNINNNTAGGSRDPGVRDPGVRGVGEQPNLEADAGSGLGSLQNWDTVPWNQIFGNLKNFGQLGWGGPYGGGWGGQQQGAPQYSGGGQFGTGSVPSYDWAAQAQQAIMRSPQLWRWF